MENSPLRDTYISCSEPIYPYHGNYVVVNLSRPHCLNIPNTVSSLWDVQVQGWQNVASPSWADPSRNFIMPTHCIRPWSNGNYWWNPAMYTTRTLQPITRTAAYGEPQLGSSMYMLSLLLGMTNYTGVSYQYSQYDNPTNYFGDSYRYNNVENSRPFYSPVPLIYQHINDSFVQPLTNALHHIAGFNLTIFDVEFTTLETIINPCHSLGRTMELMIKTIVPRVDLSGCWLEPPSDYNAINSNDWNGLYPLETTNGTPYSNGSPGEQLTVLSAISTELDHCTQYFEVIVPVQLFTLQTVGSDFTFTLQDISNGTPTYGPNMEIVATRLRGIFWDAVGEPTTANHATYVHFEIIHPKGLLSIAHCFHDTHPINRPLFCSETNALPLKRPHDVSTCLVISPRCGPGMWTNLPQSLL